MAPDQVPSPRGAGGSRSVALLVRVWFEDGGTLRGRLTSVDTRADRAGPSAATVAVAASAEDVVEGVRAWLDGVLRDPPEEEVGLLVLFDLGETLESRGVLRAGALDTLEELAGLRRGGRPAVVLGLLSDTRDPVDRADVAVVVAEYRALLDRLGIRRFFEPLARHVTLSAEVGVRKPAAAAFRAAVERAGPALEFGDVVFVTENAEHVRAARQLGLTAVRVRAEGAPGAGGAELSDVLPVVRQLLASVPDDPAPTGA